MTKRNYRERKPATPAKEEPAKSTAKKSASKKAPAKEEAVKKESTKKPAEKAEKAPEVEPAETPPVGESAEEEQAALEATDGESILSKFKLEGPIIEKLPDTGSFDPFEVPVAEHAHTGGPTVDQPVEQQPGVQESPSPDEPVFDDSQLNGVTEEPSIGPQPGPELDPEEPPEQQIEDESAEPGEEDHVTDDKMRLPSSAAARTADQAIDMFNYIMLNYGGFIVDVKLPAEMQQFDRMVSDAKERSEENRQTLPLDKEDKQILRPALIDVLMEEGLEATPKQRLLLAAALIIGKKVGNVVQVRRENKKMLKNFMNYMKEYYEQHPEHKPPGYGEATTEEEEVTESEEQSTEPEESTEE